MMYIHHKSNGWPMQMNQLNGFVLAMWPCHPMFCLGGKQPNMSMDLIDQRRGPFWGRCMCIFV